MEAARAMGMDEVERHLLEQKMATVTLASHVQSLPVSDPTMGTGPAQTSRAKQVLAPVGSAARRDALEPLARCTRSSLPRMVADDPMVTVAPLRKVPSRQRALPLPS